MKIALIFSIQLLATSILAQDSNLDLYKKHFDKELKKWTLSFSSLKLSDFRKTETALFENNHKKDFTMLKSFCAVYKPILTFSKHSTLFIDIYSYQLNLEMKENVYRANPVSKQAIYLCNQKTKF